MTSTGIRVRPTKASPRYCSRVSRSGATGAPPFRWLLGVVMVFVFVFSNGDSAEDCEFIGGKEDCKLDALVPVEDGKDECKVDALAPVESLNNLLV